MDKEQLTRNRQQKKLDPDGLSSRQRAFANAYLEDPSSKTAAAKAAGYSGRTARQKGHALSRSPKILTAIRRAMKKAGIVDPIALTHKILTHHLAVIETKATDIWVWDGVDLKIKPFDEMPDYAIEAIRGISRTPTQHGYADKIEVADKLPHLRALTALLQAQTASRAASQDSVAEIIKSVREGKCTATDAALLCDEKGYPIPRSIELILAKEKPVGTDSDGDVPELTAEELEARANAKLAEAEGQRDAFVPQRQAGVRRLKDEHKARESFMEQDKLQ